VEVSDEPMTSIPVEMHKKTPPLRATAQCSVSVPIEWQSLSVVCVGGFEQSTTGDEPKQATPTQLSPPPSVVPSAAIYTTS
jgi:hypothetical protein